MQLHGGLGGSEDRAFEAHAAINDEEARIGVRIPDGR
jgi:hypothetical protein